MSDFQAIADRVEIEALRGEFTDAAMMCDRARLASLFAHDGVLRMPNIPVELAAREEIRAGGERLQAQWEFFVQTTHPGAIQLDGDTATGRAFRRRPVAAPGGPGRGPARPAGPACGPAPPSRAAASASFPLSVILMHFGTWQARWIAAVSC
jgi:ketosteroid isomerase-like protein